MYFTSFSKDTNESDINSKNAEKYNWCLHQNLSHPEVIGCPSVETELGVCQRTNSFPVGPLWRRSHNFRMLRNAILKTLNCSIYVNCKPKSARLCLFALTASVHRAPPSPAVSVLRLRNTTTKRNDGNLFLSRESLLHDWHRSNYLSHCLCM